MMMAESEHDPIDDGLQRLEQEFAKLVPAAPSEELRARLARELAAAQQRRSPSQRSDPAGASRAG